MKEVVFLNITNESTGETKVRMVDAESADKVYKMACERVRRDRAIYGDTDSQCVSLYSSYVGKDGSYAQDECIRFAVI